MSPYAGADDLNDPAALQLEGVLFMEGEGEPTERTNLMTYEPRRRTSAAPASGLATPCRHSWDIAADLIEIPGLEELLGDRHRIIARLLVRAADILDRIDFTPTALRADLACPRRAAALVHSAAEMINRAADLCSDSAGLVNDNERRWRVFRERVVAITGAVD